MAALDQSTHTLTFKVSIAWWFKPYIHIITALCSLTGREPDYSRVNYWIGKAVSVKMPRRPWFRFMCTRDGRDGMTAGLLIATASAALTHAVFHWMPV